MVVVFPDTVLYLVVLLLPTTMVMLVALLYLRILLLLPVLLQMELMGVVEHAFQSLLLLILCRPRPPPAMSLRT